MTDRYAVLGWGSLLWDLDDLEPKVTGDWHMLAGPALPMEFARVSPKRKMGLVLCLDADQGHPCPTHAIASVRESLAEVVEDLAARERTGTDQIGGVCLATGDRQGREDIAATIADWCGRAGWKGAVWTDLKTNYAERLGTGFSIPHATAYLRGLTGESLDEAVRYIHNAPATTDTPLRRTLATDPWWQAEVARISALAPGG